MRESVIYQSILEEGREQAAREIATNMPRFYHRMVCSRLGCFRGALFSLQ